MNRSGIPTLNAGAYDNLPGSSLRLSGDQRPTYTQRRRTQMAGGGIMGSNAGSMLVAPTADGSRPGYWGLPSWDTVKKIGQTLIPGGETGYVDLYGGKDPLEIAKDVINPADPSTWQTPPYVPEESSGFDWKKALATVLPGGDPGYIPGGLYNAAGNLIFGGPTQAGEPGVNEEALLYAEENTFTNELVGSSAKFQDWILANPFMKQFFRKTDNHWSSSSELSSSGLYRPSLISSSTIF